MPPIESPIGKILEATRVKMSGSYGNVKQMWIPPDNDPLTGNVSGPERYYSADLWQFIWSPFRQFRDFCQLNSVECVHGCGCGKLIQKGSRWRPMFKHGEIVWLMYDRILCKSCKRYTSTIDPRFLAKLPTIVTERLPFITTATGPGIHVDMIFMLNSLKTKQIIEGSFASMINEVHRIRYDRSRVGYFDRMEHTAKQDTSGFYDQQMIPPMYSPYNQPGHFGGIKLTKAALKAASNSYMKAKENYMQNSFQLQSDAALFTDHTHKFPKAIRASGRPGKIFSAGYTGVGLEGAINFERLTFTKSNAELKQFIGEYKEGRDNADAGRLRMHGSDNLAGDGSLFTNPNTFGDDLNQNVVPFQPPSPNCVRAS
eukprot:scaffold188116_cov35-Attheya_sp.AAC.1